MSTDKPDYSSPEFERFAPMWAKVDACKGGTEAMRAAALTTKDSIGESPYLPQWPNENDDVYAQRLASSTFYPAYGDTLTGIVGTILKKPVRLNDNVPLSIQADAENIDRAGTHLDVFNLRLLGSGIHYGAAYVLVEMPRKPDGIVDRAQADALDFRPFWLLYSAKELADWPVYVTINGKPVLQQIRFRERRAELDGFAQTEVDRYRVWVVPVEVDESGNYQRTGNAVWQIWEERETVSGKGRSATKKKELVMIEAGMSPLADIPVAVFNANPCLDEPKETEGSVLMDMANVNIKLYQQQSEHGSNLHLCTPIPYTVNLNTDAEDGGIVSKFALGAGLLYHTREGGGFAFAEPQGTGLAERRTWMDGIKQELVDMGMSLAIEGSQRPNQTATESMLRAGSRASRLTQIARAFQDCVETALSFHAQWKGESEGGEITLGVKDSDLVLSDQRLATLSAMNEKGQLSLKTLWANMASGGVLPDDFNADDELKAIAEEKAAMPQPAAPVIPNGQQQGATQ